MQITIVVTVVVIVPIIFFPVCIHQVSTLPCGLHSHCTILFNDGLLIIGGLNSSMIPQSSTLYLHPCEMEGTIEWKLSSVTFTPQLPARYM